MNIGYFIGNVTKEAQTRTTQSGKQCGTFSVACNRQYEDKATGETKSSADYINVVLWGNYDLSCLVKGTPVIVTGRLQTRSYETNGTKKWITEIIASDVGIALRPRKSGGGNFSQFGENDGYSRPQEAIPF